MRKLAFGLICLTTALLAGCATRDSSLAQTEGTEPQRLAFGQPGVVKAAFAAKMQACWFSGTLPLLGGYQYDGKPGVVQASNTQAETDQITISSGSGDNTHTFVVQFTPYNDNTLISTRAVNIPSDLAARLKHDVETWIFARGDCGAQYGQPGVTPAINTTPETSTAAQQTARLRSSPDIPENAVSANVGSTSRTAHSRGTD